MSPFGICKVSVACLRSLPDHDAPLISQALFGENVEIVSRKNNKWFKVRCCWDHTVGWMDPRQLHVVKEVELRKMDKEADTFALDHLTGLSSEATTIPISLGSDLHHCDGINVRYPFGKYTYNGTIVSLAQSRHSPKLLVNIARRYLHTPYQRGGRSVLGLDNGGLTQMIYKMIGIRLPRSVIDQSKIGYDIGFHSEAKVGDLVFCESVSGGGIDKCGIVLEPGMVLHLDSYVKVDVLDQQGIYDANRKKYLSQLRSIRRVNVLTEKD